jgi:hypothetical protein
MKRIYLTGAAILLFIILGINYYYKKNLPSVNDNAASAQTYSVTPRVSPVDNAPATPLPDTPPLQASQSTSDDLQTSGADLQSDKKGFSANRSNTFYGHKKNSGSCGTRTVHHAAHRSTTHRVATRKTIHRSAPECAALPTVPAPEVTTTLHSSPVELKVEITKEYTGNMTTTARSTSTTTKLKEKVKYGGVKVGIEGGPNMNIFHESLTHEAGLDNMWMANFHAGLLFDFGLSRNWSLQLAPRYIGKGDAFQLNSDYKEKLSLHYLELPVNFVYKTGNPGHTRFMIGGGGYISYLASLEDHILGNDDNNIDPANPPSPLFGSSDVRTLDWGAGGFLGVETPVGFTVKAGGELGLRQIMQNTTTNEYQFRNSSLLFSVGYLFGGARK